MRDDLPAATTTAQGLRATKLRHALWITAFDRTTNAPTSFGFWSGALTRSLSVIDALTRATVSRSFLGLPALGELPDIPLTSDITVREIDVTFSQISADALNVMKGYSVRYAPVQIYRVNLSVDTDLPVAAAYPRFVGFVNLFVMKTPKVNERGRIHLSLVSQSRELTKSSPDMRSDESQQARFAGDRFYKYTKNVARFETPWGMERGKPAGKKPNNDRVGPKTKLRRS